MTNNQRLQFIILNEDEFIMITKLSKQSIYSQVLIVNKDCNASIAYTITQDNINKFYISKKNIFIAISNIAFMSALSFFS